MPKQQKSRRRFNQGGQQREREEGRVTGEKTTRNRYTIKQKITIVEYAMVRMEEDLASLTDIAHEAGVDKSSLSRWIDQLPQLRHINRNDEVSERRSLVAGRRSLEDVGADLLAFVEDLRGRGYPVSRKMIVVKACRLLGTDSAFSSKSYAARAQSVSRWMARNHLTIRTGTHQAQAPPETVSSAAEDFMVNIARPAVNQSYRDRRFIINMDQTPVFFSMHPSRSVDTIGSRTVNIRIAKDGSQRATVAVCFTASGHQLKSLVIFRGKQIYQDIIMTMKVLLLLLLSHYALAIMFCPGKETDKGGRIMKKEGHTYPTDALFATQEKAWMSEALMLLWIEKILKPYLLTAPPGIVPLLFLDSFGVHKMGSVNRAINDLGCEVIIIPPGCTGLTQPVDVGYNKPFKNLVRDKYEEWMVMESEDLSIPPRRINVARWIIESEREMDANILRNAWMRHDLEYFPAGYTPPASTVIQRVVTTQSTITVGTMMDALPPMQTLPPMPSLPPMDDCVTDEPSDDDMEASDGDEL